MHDDKCTIGECFVLVFLVALIAFIAGTGISFNLTNSEWENRCNKAGVKFVHHKTVVDGAVTTNWIEVVRLDK